MFYRVPYTKTKEELKTFSWKARYSYIADVMSANWKGTVTCPIPHTGATGSQVNILSCQRTLFVQIKNVMTFRTSGTVHSQLHPLFLVWILAFLIQTGWRLPAASSDAGI